MKADGTCQPPPPPAPSPKSFRYIATSDDPSCTPAQTTVDAQLDIANAPTDTLCCR